MVTPLSNLTDQVMELIRNDADLKGSRIEAGADRGIVTLTGSVKTEAARQRAEDLAKSLPAVVTVINEIKIG